MNHDKCVHCKSIRSRSPGVKFFRFPKEEQRCKEWVMALNLESLLGVPATVMYKKYRVCSRHFQDQDYHSSKKERLNKTACPAPAAITAVNNITISKLQKGLKQKLVGQCAIASHSSTIKLESSTDSNEMPDYSEGDAFKSEDEHYGLEVLTNTPKRGSFFNNKKKFTMPDFCSAYGCSNTSDKANCRNEGISFHPFPLNDEERLIQWLVKIRRENFHPNSYHRLCSDHFYESDFTYESFTNGRQLKNTAVPTKFCNTTPEKPARLQSSNEVESTIVQHDTCKAEASSEKEKFTQTDSSFTNHLFTEIERLKTENAQLKTDVKKITEYLLQLFENQ